MIYPGYFIFNGLTPIQALHATRTSDISPPTRCIWAQVGQLGRTGVWCVDMLGDESSTTEWQKWWFSDWCFGTWIWWLSIYWEESSQLANSIIFQRGWYTTNQFWMVWGIYEWDTCLEELPTRIGGTLRSLAPSNRWKLLFDLEAQIKTWWLLPY